MNKQVDIEKLTQLIREKASKEARSDTKDFNAMDYSGGNFDDAFSMGVGDGGIFFARKLLKFLGE